MDFWFLKTPQVSLYVWKHLLIVSKIVKTYFKNHLKKLKSFQIYLIVKLRIFLANNVSSSTEEQLITGKGFFHKLAVLKQFIEMQLIWDKR